MANINCLVILLCAGLIALALIFTFDNSNQTNPSRLSVVKDESSRKSCVLPPHPSSGWWSMENHVSNSTLVPMHTYLRVHCNESYKLEGPAIVVCNKETWFPRIGRCLKTCPSLYSTTKTTVTCIFKEQATANCTQPVVGTLAQFRCASFYEDRRRSKTRAVCRNNGEWSEIPDCSPVCGRAIIAEAPVLTVGGTITKKGEFPWQIALYTIEDKVLICGGSVLNERVILTAAHCVTDVLSNTILPIESFLIVAGKYYRKFNHSEDSMYTQVSEIHDIFVPAEYEGEDQNFAYDVAIIVTKKTLKFSTTIQPVCIDWQRKYENKVFSSNNYYGYVSGWGNTKQDSQPANELKKIMVPSVLRKECKKHVPNDFKRYVTYDKFCAGYINKSTSVCNGDSGGGLVYKYEDEDEDRYFIVGIVSIAPQTKIASIPSCDSQKYSLYTLVYNHTDFILPKIVEFEPSRTNEEICNNCREPDVNTEPPITELTTLPSDKNQTKYCTLPDNGRWTVDGGPLGTTVPLGTIIEINCEKGYRYNAPNSNVCRNGKWSEPFGKCLKTTCSSLYNSEKRNVTCSIRERLLKDCIEPINGTIARFQCAKFYELLHVETRPSVCLNGEWSYIPDCWPACGQASPDSSKVKFPWYVAIYRSVNNTKSLICGGTLVSLNVIVTAGRCITDKTSKEFTVAAGIYHRQFNHTEDVEAQFSAVYVVRNLKTFAIVVIEKSFKLSTTVQPVCWHWLLIEIPVGARVSSVTWGSTEADKKPAEVLVEQKFNLYNEGRCSHNNSNFYEICVRPVTNDAHVCGFDSGRGLFIETKGRYYLKGVEKAVTEYGVYRNDEMCSSSSGNQTVTIFSDIYLASFDIAGAETLYANL